MDWVLNQIWLGDDAPKAELEAAEEKAKSFGWGYHLWNWEELTSTFGAFYFRNFILSKLPGQGLTFLTKFYLWFVLSKYKGKGIFLDATASFPFPLTPPSTMLKESGVYTAPDYSASFLAATNERAILLAKDEVLQELDVRYRANGKYMFNFFSSIAHNILGPRYMARTLIPIWSHAGIPVFNHIDHTKTTELMPAVPSYLLPSVVDVQPIRVKEEKSAAKVKPLDLPIPPDCSRVFIIGESVMGITDVDMVAHPGDMVVHLDSCPFFTPEVQNGVYQSVFYSHPKLLPQRVKVRKKQFYTFRRIFPGVSFAGYDWATGVAGKISSHVALACAYKEKNPGAQVFLYGHNPVDDISRTEDTSLESGLLNAQNISVIQPKYDFLFLVLTRRSHHAQRALVEKSWVPRLCDTKHTYRFCCAKGDAFSPVPMVWPLEDAGDDMDDLDAGLKVYAALRHAQKMQVRYIFLFPDDTWVHPLRMCAWVDNFLPVTFGRRCYSETGKVLFYDFGAGIGLSSSALDSVLRHLSSELISLTKSRPDLMLAYAIKEAELGTTDASEFCLDAEAKDADVKKIFSYAGRDEKAFLSLSQEM